MSAKLNTWSKVYAAARKSTVQHDYFAPRDMFNGREHDTPVQVGEYAYFVDSIAYDDGSNRQYRVKRISAAGRVESSPFQDKGKMQVFSTLEEAIEHRNAVTFHESRKIREKATNYQLDEL